MEIIFDDKIAHNEWIKQFKKAFYSQVLRAKTVTFASLLKMVFNTLKNKHGRHFTAFGNTG
jgi:hypothetical protein